MVQKVLIYFYEINKSQEVIYSMVIIVNNTLPFRKLLIEYTLKVFSKSKKYFEWYSDRY